MDVHNVLTLVVNVLTITGTMLAAFKMAGGYFSKLNIFMKDVLYEINQLKLTINSVESSISKINDNIKYLSNHNTRIRYILNKLEEISIQNTKENGIMLELLIKLGAYLENTQDPAQYKKFFNNLFELISKINSDNKHNISLDFFDHKFIDDTNIISQ